MPCRLSITARRDILDKRKTKMLMESSTRGFVEERAFDPAKTPYEIDEKSFPADGSLEEQFAFLLRYSVLAPSSYNTQPWKFELLDEGIAVYADYTRRLPVADPGSRELLMGVGAAIFNLRVAATHFRFAHRVAYNHTGDSEQPIAFVSLFPAEATDLDESLNSLFPCITKRHTNRSSFLVTRIPEALLKNLRMLAEGSQVSLFLSTDGTVNQRVADLVAAADQKQQADSAYRGERAEWVRSNWSKMTDGMPSAALGIKGMTSVLAPWATKVLDLGRLRAAADKNLCVQAPGLMVMHGEDAVPVWLETGEVLQRLLLTLTRAGLQYSFFNMPIEVPELRTQLRGVLGLSSWPQLLLRIGYCFTEPVASPRRPIEEVIVQQGRTKPSFT